MKRYKAVPGPQSIKVEKGHMQSAFYTFEEIINREAALGWEYHSMETIVITEKPGCFNKPVPTSYYMLIFEKDVDPS